MNMNAPQYTPIKSLNTFLFDWRIKARITKKHPKKEWRNAKGSGTLLNIDLMDSLGGQIQATFFKEQADKYNEILQENKVYLFSNGIVKMANQKYSSIKNDYCITLDKNADIQECGDDEAIQQVGYSFQTIDEINDCE
jgi:replication factor A1